MIKMKIFTVVLLYVITVNYATALECYVCRGCEKVTSEDLQTCPPISSTTTLSPVTAEPTDLPNTGTTFITDSQSTGAPSTTNTPITEATVTTTDALDTTTDAPGTTNLPTTDATSTSDSSNTEDSSTTDSLDTDATSTTVLPNTDSSSTTDSASIDFTGITNTDATSTSTSTNSPNTESSTINIQNTDATDPSDSINTATSSTEAPNTPPNVDIVPEINEFQNYDVQMVNNKNTGYSRLLSRSLKQFRADGDLEPRCVVTYYKEPNSDTKEVVRGCSYESDDIEARCREAISSNFSADLVTCKVCNGDHCNSATKSISTVFVLVLAFIINICL